MPKVLIQIDPFTNIPFIELPTPTNENAGSTFLSDLREFSIGDGTQVFRADRSGLWLGGKTFDTATFSVSMAGAIVASDFTLTGGTIKYGKTSFTDSTNAGYFMSALGFYFGSAGDATKLKYIIATGALDYIGTLSGRESSTLASAINASGQLITDVVNSKLSTSSQQILQGFTFGVSGAIQIGTYVSGVSGDIRITPNGIVGRNKDNATTFSIDAVTGDPTFAGTLVAAAGTLGIITAGTFQTAPSGQRVVISGSENLIRFYDSGGVDRGTIYGIPTGIGITGDIDAGSVNLNVYAINLTKGTGSAITVTWNNSVDIGSNSYRFRDLYLGGNVYVNGNVDGVDVALLKSTYDTHVGNADAHHAQSHSHGSHSGIGASDHHSSVSDNLTITPANVDIKADGYIKRAGTNYARLTSLGFDLYQPLGLRQLSSPPGSASDYLGFMYWDTTQTDIVFSNGIAWYKVSADPI